MAGIKGLKEFRSKVRKIKRILNKEYFNLVRDLTKEANKMLIMNTRFRSGTARNSWVATLGAPTNETPVILPQPSSNFRPPIRRITQGAVAKNNVVISSWDLKKPLYIASNLDYIVYLEEGRQNIRVPNHMLKNTITAMEMRIDDAFAEIEAKILQIWR